MEEDRVEGEKEAELGKIEKISVKILTKLYKPRAYNRNFAVFVPSPLLV